VGRNSLAPDGQSAWWRARYRLRRARDAAGQPAADAAGAPLHDVPALLEAAKDAILATGALRGADRLCSASFTPAWLLRLGACSAAAACVLDQDAPPWPQACRCPGRMLALGMQSRRWPV
jgi:hypothetical protein